MVPDHLDAALRNREGVGQLVTHNTVATLHQLSVAGIVSRCFIDGFGHANAATGFEYRHAKSGRIAPEHGDLTGCQVVLILFKVGCGDNKQRLVVGIGVSGEAAFVNRCGVGGQTTGPGRDGASGVAGHFRANRRQAAAKIRCLLRVDRNSSTTQHQGSGPEGG